MVAEQNTLSDRERALLRWRARRGMLENDLIISRFLAEAGPSLDRDEVSALLRLFDVEDNELLDIFLGRAGLPASCDDPLTRRLVERMKAL